MRMILAAAGVLAVCQAALATVSVAVSGRRAFQLTPGARVRWHRRRR